jgi:hypothetical protein
MKKRREWSRLCAAVLGMAVALLATAAQANAENAMRLHEMARTLNRPPGAPKYSDVSMRLFRLRKGLDLIATGRAFHITRGDWSYIQDKDFIRKVREQGWSFQGTMNAVTHDPEQAVKDKHGKPVLDHFKKPGRYWADCYSEKHRDWYVKELVRWAELGVDSIQRDEPTAIRHWSVPDAVRFFKHVHAQFEKQIGRMVPMSCNLAWNRSMFGGRGWPITRLFDFGMAEMGRREVHPRFLRRAALDARKRDRFLVYTTHQNLGVPTYRRAIAGCYANGMLFVVPWDQFAGTRSARVFSKPGDLADLYGFVRANAGLLDGYEDAAVAGHGLKETRYGKDLPLELEGGAGVSAYARARPGDAKAPVVVHLVEWSKPEPFRVRLRTKCFFGGRPPRVQMRSPAPYDAEAHEKAEQTGIYDPLCATKRLDVRTDGPWSLFEVPALNPWGLLVVSPDD